jgi:hypothetical protein
MIEMRQDFRLQVKSRKYDLMFLLQYLDASIMIQTCIASFLLVLLFYNIKHSHGMIAILILFINFKDSSHFSMLKFSLPTFSHKRTNPPDNRRIKGKKKNSRHDSFLCVHIDIRQEPVCLFCYMNCCPLAQCFRF